MPPTAPVCGPGCSGRCSTPPGRATSTRESPRTTSGSTPESWPGTKAGTWHPRCPNTAKWSGWPPPPGARPATLADLQRRQPLQQVFHRLDLITSCGGGLQRSIVPIAVGDAGTTPRFVRYQVVESFRLRHGSSVSSGKALGPAAVLGSRFFPAFAFCVLLGSTIEQRIQMRFGPKALFHSNHEAHGVFIMFGVRIRRHGWYGVRLPVHGVDMLVRMQALETCPRGYK